jgi:hypothetical protein
MVAILPTDLANSGLGHSSVAAVAHWHPSHLLESLEIQMETNVAYWN